VRVTSSKDKGLQETNNKTSFKTDTHVTNASTTNYKKECLSIHWV